jgi:hypothetical protein
MKASEYAYLTELKFEVARYHLREFKRLLPTGPGVCFNPRHRQVSAPIHAHADAAIFETFAAFETFSCAVAHECGWKGADVKSFAEVANDERLPTKVRRSMRATIRSDRWDVLDELRNIVGHRAVVTSRFVNSSESGFKIFLADPTRHTTAEMSSCRSLRT